MRKRFVYIVNAISECFQTFSFQTVRIESKSVRRKQMHLRILR